MKNKFGTTDFLVAAVIVSSIALRNYPYLLYLIQIIFLMFCAKTLLTTIPKKYFLSRVILVTIMLCSLLWADNNDAVIKVLPSIIQIFVICITLSGYINSTERIEKCINYIIIASIVLVINLLISTPLSEWKEIIYYSSGSYVDIASSSGRLGFTIAMHPNEFGVVIVICFLCVFYKFYNTKNKKYIFLNLILCILLILSKSRSSLLEAILGVFLVYILQQKTNTKKVKTIMISCVICIVILWSIINIPVLYNLIGYRMEGVLNLFLGSETADASTSTRLEFIKIGISIFKGHPLLGVGMNNYSVVAYRDYSTWAQVYAHNNYIEILSDIGVVGVISYYLIYIISFFKLNKAIKFYRKTQQTEKFSIAGFLMSLLLTCVVINFSHITYDNECIQYIALLIIVGSYLLNNSKRNAINVSISEEYNEK